MLPHGMIEGEPNTSSVTCPACGSTLPRNDALEYDRLGDRWDRNEKSFEYLCKGCYREESHYPRDRLEETLILAGGPYAQTGDFIAAYYHQVASIEDSEAKDA